MLDSPEPASIMDALDQIRQRDSELSRIRQRLAQAQQELEDTNRGLIALYSELEEARQAEARLAAVVQASDDAIISMTPTGVIQTWNPGATRLLGRPEGQVIGRPLNIVMSAQARALFVQSLDQLQFGATAAPFDTQWSRSDGSEVHVTVSVFALRDDTGALTGISAVARDITAKIEAKNQLERLAHFDTLTGLVNRAETLVRLESALADTRIPGKHVGVLFCDIDHFKSINDTWGIPSGTSCSRPWRDALEIASGMTTPWAGWEEMRCSSCSEACTASTRPPTSPRRCAATSARRSGTATTSSAPL